MGVIFFSPSGYVTSLMLDCFSGLSFGSVPLRRQNNHEIILVQSIGHTQSVGILFILVGEVTRTQMGVRQCVAINANQVFYWRKKYREGLL